MVMRAFITKQLVANILVDSLASDVTLHQPLCCLKFSINLAFPRSHLMFTSLCDLLFREYARADEKIFFIIIFP